MNLHTTTDGLILQTLSIGDHNTILTLYTKELGIVKAATKRGQKRAAYDPLTRAEFILKAGRGDLFQLSDLSVTSYNIHLRSNLAWLLEASKMARAVQHSQMLGKPSPDLYRLLAAYVEKLPSCTPGTLLASFYLKLMRHEGQLHLADRCSLCNKELTAFRLMRGETICPEEAPHTAPLFAADEAPLVHLLGHASTFRQLASLTVPENLTQRIFTTFCQLFNCK